MENGKALVMEMILSEARSNSIKELAGKCEALLKECEDFSKRFPAPKISCNVFHDLILSVFVASSREGVLKYVYFRLSATNPHRKTRSNGFIFSNSMRVIGRVSSSSIVCLMPSS